MTTITMNCKPFSDFPRGEHRLSVDEDGTVKVYDSVAGHYTTCHELSERSQAAARRKAMVIFRELSDYCSGCGCQVDDRPGWTFCSGGGPQCGSRCPDCGPKHDHE